MTSAIEVPQLTTFEEYLPYVGAGAGLLVTGAIAAYYATRPTPETPLVPLDAQCRVLPVISIIKNIYSFFLFFLIKTKN